MTLVIMPINPGSRALSPGRGELEVGQVYDHVIKHLLLRNIYTISDKSKRWEFFAVSAFNCIGIGYLNEGIGL
jgi:hypothetical protein